jgi:lipid-A-disaccharide synthase
MRDCRSAIAKSGSVTLELALHRRPTVVMYKISLLNRLFAKFLLRLNLSHYCIVNILNGKTTFPELIEKGLSSNNLFDALKKIHDDGPERMSCIDGCHELASLLKDNQASHKASEAIMELLS